VAHRGAVSNLPGSRIIYIQKLENLHHERQFMAKYPGVSAEVLKELAKYDTPTIANAVELWNRYPRNLGYMNGSIVACYPKLPPMVGFALTTTFRSMAPPRGGDAYSGIAQQIESF